MKRNQLQRYRGYTIAELLIFVGTIAWVAAVAIIAIHFLNKWW